MIKVSVIFGTRPEVIKVAILIKHLKKSNLIELSVCLTGQHKEMVLPLIDFFEIPIHHSLQIMVPNQSLAGLPARSLEAIDTYLVEAKPDLVFVQGDTTTAMYGAVAAFYRKIKIAHIEAGLRTFNKNSPFPEEFNRQVISKIADLHFAPTQQAVINLKLEKIEPTKIFLTGNTVIDALYYTRNKIKEDVSNELNYPWMDQNKPYILITGHRRENFGRGFENICFAIKTLSLKYKGYNFIYPVHLNPNVQIPVKQILSGADNVFLIQPLDYVQFTQLLASCYFVLTDSGGIQEEAPTFGKPVLVMRDSTERMEAIEAGVALLVGTDAEKIVYEASRLIDDKQAYQKMSNKQNPFGQGDASQKITEHVLQFLDIL